MTHVKCLLTLTILGLMTLSMHPIQAQETSEDSFDLVDYAAAKKVTVEFAGGTVEQFVAILQEKAPDLNVMVRSDVKKITLPSLRLRNISVGSAISSLDNLSLDSLVVQLSENADYYIVGPNFNQRSVKDKVIVLNVSMYLLEDDGETLSKDRQTNLLSAIEDGAELMGENKGTMQISFHAATGLLFVKGNEAETELVSIIVESLIHGT